MQHGNPRRPQIQQAPTSVNVPPYAEMEKMPPKTLLRRLGLFANKSFSQNFLTDSYVVKDIVAAAELSPSDEVLEVGPGLGILTRELVRTSQRVVAVELDKNLADLLPRLVPEPSRLEVVQGDIRNFDPATAFQGEYKVVANLPYSVTSPVLRQFLTGVHKPSVMVVMVQKEVAERIAAGPGDTSVMTIMAQLYSRVSLVRQVEASAFYPAPEVDSAVLKLEVYQELPFGGEDPEGLIALVAAGFSRRRKQLHNSLGQSLWFPAGGVFQVLEEAGIDPSRRAQTLTLQEWDSLYRSYSRFRDLWKAEAEG